MSPPDTDVKTQKKQHRAALNGIRGAMILAGAMLLGLIVVTVWKGESPIAPKSDAEPAGLEEAE